MKMMYSRCGLDVATCVLLKVRGCSVQISAGLSMHGSDKHEFYFQDEFTQTFVSYIEILNYKTVKKT